MPSEIAIREAFPADAEDILRIPKAAFEGIENKDIKLFYMEKMR